ncbi:MAG: hypothetical protein D4S01_05945 [Dehalococcoidia bacterium]|nr:MAG: hypothetical protein D4S01_05945 [Dehalococcoidia bacterium]
MSIKALADYTQYSKYAKYNKDKKRRETWGEQVDRVFRMHEDKLGDKLELVKEEFDSAKDMVKRKRVLGSQRALQFGGDPILSKNAKMYNCFRRNTSFITSNGVKSFNDYENGQEITVLTHTGNWKSAIVRSYGEQEVYPIVFNKGKSKENTIWSTKDHSWILKDGSRTTSLSEGDQIFRQPNLFNDWEYENAAPDERMYWSYGLVCGDGTRIQDKDGNNKYSMIRLCGRDSRFAPRFEELGFKTSTNNSLNGDFYAYTGTYLKELPDVEKDDVRLIRAFVRGLLDADGEKNKSFNGSGSMFVSIQQSNKDVQEFIRKSFPMVGVYILSETYNDRDTNYGKHDAVLFRLSTSCEGSSPIWRVKEIKRDCVKETVWCLEVEDDHSFVMPNGIVTGNCTVSYVDRPRFFQECMYLLLCGCGTGFSVQTHHIAKLPNIRKRTKKTQLFVVPDTIEGWADAVGVLMSSYFDVDEGYHCYDYNDIAGNYSGCPVEFDFSCIREKGAHISWGGKAPGPDGLKNAIVKIEQLLDSLVAEGKTKLEAIHAYDIIMHASDAVLSGGVRRSATICLFSPEDQDMVEAKTGNWIKTNPQRARSNNSALLIRNETSKEQFEDLMKSVKEFGEPGFVWSEDKELLVNPCVEIGMRAYTKDGRSGWQFCNLCEMNMKKVKSEEDFINTCHAAAVIGTIQASYDHFDYLTEATMEIVRREALLGVSMTGMMDSPDVAFSPEIQRRGAKEILKVNEKIAPLIGINLCARATCVKPAGSTSCVLGTASGIHPHHAKRYFRRVQANELEFPLQHFMKHNPEAVERSVWDANGTDYVINFLCEVPDGAKTKNQVGALDLLDHVRLTQQNWIEAGTRKSACTAPWLRHNVSNTINVKPDEWDDVTNYIYKNRKWFAGISLLSHSGDMDYAQTPFATVLNEKELVQIYGEGTVFASGLVVDGLHAFDNNLWKACDCVLGIGEKLVECQSPEEPIMPEKNGYTAKQWAGKLAAYAANLAVYNDEKESYDICMKKTDWVRRFNQFAERYCDNNIRRCTHMLKHVSLWKQWLDLKRVYKDIDWSEVVEEDYQIDVSSIAGAACSGKGCERGDLGDKIDEQTQRHEKGDSIPTSAA